MTHYEYESIVAYYGGTPPETLRKYAAQSTDQGDHARAIMLSQLADEMERGVRFIVNDQDSKLSYRRAP